MKQGVQRIAVKNPRLRGLITGLFILSTFAVLLYPAPVRFLAPVWHELLNVSHIPLFAVLTIILLHFLPRTWLAIGAACLIVLTSELGQTVVHRSASGIDILWGLCGVVLGATWTFAASRPRSSRKWAVATAVSAVVTVALLAIAGPTLVDGWRAWREFPVLTSFDHPLQSRRWSAQKARLEIASHGAGNQQAGRLTIPATPPTQAGLILFPVIRDWSNYRLLRLDLACSGDPLSLLISVRDGRHVPPPKKRFDHRQTYPPGRHTIEINLDEIARGGRFAPIDLTRIESFHLVVENHDRQIVLWLHDLRLEK